MKIAAERKSVSRLTRADPVPARPRPARRSFASSLRSSAHFPRRGSRSSGVPFSPRWRAPPCSWAASAARARRHRQGARGHAPQRGARAHDTARRSARRLPRCRAHRDRHLRAGRAAREGARTVRIAPGRAARGHRGRGEHRGRANTRPDPPGGEPGGDGRGHRRNDGGLRLDAAPPRASRSRVRSPGPATRCSTASRPRSRPPASSRSPRPLSRRVSSSKSSPEPLTP